MLNLWEHCSNEGSSFKMGGWGRGVLRMCVWATPRLQNLLSSWNPFSVGTVSDTEQNQSACRTASSELVSKLIQFSSVQSLSCVQLFATPMNCSTPGLPVHHQLPEFTQTHIHWVSDAIQPSHPLSSPSPPAPTTFQHQSLFQWVNFSHEVAKVLEFQL